MSQDICLDGIISYPTLFEPKQINGKGDPKYSATLILDQLTDWNAVNNAINEALAAKFGSNIPPQWKNPLQPADSEGFPGQWMVKSYGERQPQVVDQQVNPVMDRSHIFAGCKVNLYVRFYGYSTSGNHGVGVGLNAVQIVDNINVTRLDNTKDAKDVFQPVPGAPAPLAPTAYSQGQQPAPQNQPPMGQPAPQQMPPQSQPPVGQPAGGPVAQPGPGAGAPPAAGYPSNPGPGAPQQQPQAQPQGGPVAPGAPNPGDWMQ